MADFDILIAELKEVKDLIKTIHQAPFVTAPSEIINTQELMKRLDLSEPTVIAWRKRKVIPFIKIGTSIRYNWPKVIDVLEKRNK